MEISTSSFNIHNILQNKNHLISTKSKDFLINLERKIIEDISQKELFLENQTIHKKTQNNGIKNFKNDLIKYGAAGFWLKFNLDKIQKILDEKRQELTESLGLNKDTHPPLSEEQKIQATRDLEKIMSDFVKELFEKLAKQEELLESKEDNSLLTRLLQ